ncbi:hypothetical protein BC936DRAFT_143253 [Jimgerdemannia flammicorona]|uniref:Uncharacterized protein n=1 Tax=Jimgerdemannia flammicorona TaxID=994334 RepID=A0A433DME3_9FUNG|nr:hypothetical protein BC936DRAFT_143253 [Jimgerdemannia flammicorona]
MPTNTTGTIPKPRFSHTSVTNFAQHIIVYGGEDSNGTIFSDISVLDMSLSAPIWWSPPISGNIPTARFAHA